MDNFEEIIDKSNILIRPLGVFLLFGVYGV